MNKCSSTQIMWQCSLVKLGHMVKDICLYEWDKDRNLLGVKEHCKFFNQRCMYCW